MHPHWKRNLIIAIAALLLVALAAYVLFGWWAALAVIAAPFVLFGLWCLLLAVVGSIWPDWRNRS